jgi:hypothetical protein
MLVSPAPRGACVAARWLGMSTSGLLRLVHDHQIRFLMVDGIAHVPEDAIAEHEASAAS